MRVTSLIASPLRKDGAPRCPGRGYWAVARRPLRRKYRSRRPSASRRPRAALAHEALEVRERLGDREPPGGGLQVVAEERERDLVAGARVVAERGRRPRRAARGGGRGARAPARPGPRSARRGRGSASVGLERDRRLERVEVVAERVGPARRPEPDRRRDRGRAGGRRPTRTPSRSSISWPSACPGAATASQPSTTSPGSTSSGSGWKRMNGRYSDPCSISSSVTSRGTP